MWTGSYDDLMVMNHFRMRMLKKKRVHADFWTRYEREKDKIYKEHALARQYQAQLDEMYQLQMIRE